MKEQLRSRLSKQNLKTLAIDQLCFLVGSISYAVSVNVFVVPNKIAQSGFTGLAVVFNHFFPWAPIGMTHLVMNIPLIVLALVYLGWRFLSKTVWAVVEVSVVMDLVGRLVKVMHWQYEGDRLLAPIAAGVISGFGLSLIIMRGAAAGGTDVVGWLGRNRWPHVPIGRVILVADITVVIIGTIAFRDINAALYATIMIFIYTRIVDAIVYGMSNGKMFYIFSGKAQEIARAVIDEVGRGATIVPATGAYTGQRQDMLMCVVRRGEVTHLRRLVKALDPDAFLVVAEAQEVSGGGFPSAPRE